MTRTDPYELKYGTPDWCHDAKPDGQKALSSLLAELRGTPERFLAYAGFHDEKTGQSYHIDDALDNGWPFAATLHDHVDHTNLHVHWWDYDKELVCKYKITTRFSVTGIETPEEPELDFQLLESGVCNFDFTARDTAAAYLTTRLLPCPCANERVDLWWSLTGRTDQTMFHWALMPESNTWMQL